MANREVIASRPRFGFAAPGCQTGRRVRGVSSSERLFGLVGAIEAYGTSRRFPRDPFATLRQASSVVWSMEQATRAGAEIVKSAQDTFYDGYAGYFRDPNGHLWEVVWNPANLPTDE